MAGWREDILGAGFECMDLELGADQEGPLVATLVRSLPTRRSILDRMFHGKHLLADVDVLYVHGWSDYFFQRELAGFWTARGARFFALDLRKYGRSLRPGQTPGYIENLDDYDQEIELALAAMGSSSEAGGRSRRLLLLGHSTGGLVLSLWASRHPGLADALVLNSPWLEFQLSGSGRQVLTPLVKLSARLMPHEAAPQIDYGFYTRAQREVGEPGEYDGLNTAWRPDQTNPVLSGWLHAILQGHARVIAGLGITIPIQVLLSERSALPLKWGEDLTRADTVLDVAEIAKASLALGQTVTIDRIPGALHDVFLSRVAARADAYARVDRWVRGWNAMFSADL